MYIAYDLQVINNKIIFPFNLFNIAQSASCQPKEVTLEDSFGDLKANNIYSEYFFLLIWYRGLNHVTYQWEG